MIKTLCLSFGGRVPAIMGAVVWTDLQGSTTLVADAAAVTSLRTGAVVGVATDLLAPPDAATCALIGAGAQAADQIRAVHAVRPLRSLRIVGGQTLNRAEPLAGKLQSQLGITHVSVERHADQAVRDAAIVCCATPATAPLFDANSLLPTAHVNAIGAFRPTMRELPDELLADALVVVDEKVAILEESGEVIHAIDNGVISEADLVELSTALQTGMIRRGGRTVFKSVGVAVQDWAIAQLLAQHRLASPHAETVGCFT